MLGKMTKAEEKYGSYFGKLIKVVLKTREELESLGIEVRLSCDLTGEFMLFRGRQCLSHRTRKYGVYPKSIELYPRQIREKREFVDLISKNIITEEKLQYVEAYNEAAIEFDRRRESDTELSKL